MALIPTSTNVKILSDSIVLPTTKVQGAATAVGPQDLPNLSQVQGMITTATTAITKAKLAADVLSSVVLNPQTATTYTLVLADAGALVTLTNAAAIVLTIPTNATVAFPIGTIITLAQRGAGQVTVTPASGVTRNAYGSATKLSGIYAYATLTKIATNTWDFSGQITL